MLAAEARLSADGVDTSGIDDTSAANTLKTETSVNVPDCAPWEFYVKTGDAQQTTTTILADGETAQCCALDAISDSVAAGVGPASPACG